MAQILPYLAQGAVQLPVKGAAMTTRERQTIHLTDGLINDGSWSYRRSLAMLSFTGIAGWAILALIVWYSLLR